MAARATPHFQHALVAVGQGAGHGVGRCCKPDLLQKVFDLGHRTPRFAEAAGTGTRRADPDMARAGSQDIFEDGQLRENIDDLKRPAEPQSHPPMDRQTGDVVPRKSRYARNRPAASRRAC